jgi:hypothetical protein
MGSLLLFCGLPTLLWTVFWKSRLAESLLGSNVAGVQRVEDAVKNCLVVSKVRIYVVCR